MEVTYQATRRCARLARKFPNKIREFRLRAGLSQRDLAGRLNIARNTLSTWECGLVLPDLPTGLRLAKALGAMTEALFEDVACIVKDRRKRIIRRPR